MNDNPYASPAVAAAAAVSAAVSAAEDGAKRPFSSEARRIFLAWEKLRIAYVAILAIITVLLSMSAGFAVGRVLPLIVEGALVANVAFFAGPAIETYLNWLGYDRPWPRWVLFIGGTLLSIVLATGVLATELLPGQN